jgi:hypothetical protein
MRDNFKNAVILDVITRRQNLLELGTLFFSFVCIAILGVFESVKVKVVFPVLGKEACRNMEVIAPLTINLGTRWN